jgi:hypothetical protein
MTQSRNRLLDRFWEHLSGDLSDYSDMIERLLGYLTTEQIAEIVNSMDEPEGES